VKLHIFCTGAITPGVANFILEAGGGAPGLSMAGEGRYAGNSVSMRISSGVWLAAAMAVPVSCAWRAVN
jgi:hypothetical protein